MAVGQSVSNRRAERSFYAESCARRHGDGSAPLCSTTLRPLAAVVDPGPLSQGSLFGYSDGSAPLTDGSPGVPSPRRSHRRRHRSRCQFRLSRSARSPGDPRGGPPPVIPEPRLAKRSERRINSQESVQAEREKLT